MIKRHWCVLQISDNIHYHAVVMDVHRLCYRSILASIQCGKYRRRDTARENERMLPSC